MNPKVMHMAITGAGTRDRVPGKGARAGGSGGGGGERDVARRRGVDSVEGSEPTSALWREEGYGSTSG